MSILEQIEADTKEAMKEKNETKTSVLRMLKSAIKNEEIGKKKELTDDEISVVLEKQAKQRKEAIEQYGKAEREELKEKEEAELGIIEKYLPEKLSEADVEKAVDEVLASLGDEKDFGKVMGITMSKLKGKADGGVVRDIVQKKLGK